MIRILFLSLLLCLSVHARAGAYDDLMKAAKMGDTEAVLNLVARGMDVNTNDTDGSTLLMLAIRNDNLPLVEALMKYRPNLGRRNSVGEVALSLAAFGDDERLVKLLLEAGAEPDLGDWKALHYAAFKGNAATVKLLLSFGAKPDVRAPSQQTPLMLAARNDHLAVVNELLAAGANPALKDAEGHTALDIAIARKLADVEQRLRASMPTEVPAAAEPSAAAAATEPAAAAATPKD